MRRSLYIALGALVGALFLSPPTWLRAQGYIPPFSIDLREEGTSVGRALSLDCVGSAITCTFSATVGTITISGGGGAPTDAEYVVGAANGSLSAERVVTDTVIPGLAPIDFDVVTAGQLKATAYSVPLLNFATGGVSVNNATAGITGIGVGVPYGDGSGCSAAAAAVSSTEAKGTAYTCATSGNTIGHANDPPHIWGTRRFRYQGYFKLDSCSNVRFFNGLHSGTAGSSDPGGDDPTKHLAMFRLSTDASDTNYKCITNDNSGGGTITDSGVACSTSGVEYEIEYDPAIDANVRFYLNGALACTNSANLPTAGMGRFYRLAITASASKVLTVYHLGNWADR